MSNKSKNILLGVLIVGVISMTVAFAALSTRLNISGEANVAATSWNVHFQNWSLDTAATVDGHQNTAEYPTIETLTTSMALAPNITKVDNLNVTLKQPGDYAKYNFEIINEGSIDAKLSNFTATLTPTSDVIGYEVKCFEDTSRTGTEVTTNSVLTANGGVTYCYIKVQYNDQTNTSVAGQNQVYTQGEINTSLSADWTWVQDDGSSSSSSEPEETPVVNNDKYYYSLGSGQQESNSIDGLNLNVYIHEDLTTSNKSLCVVINGQEVCMQPGTWDCNYNSTTGTCDNANSYILSKKTELETAIGNNYKCNINSTTLQCNLDSTSNLCGINSTNPGSSMTCVINGKGCGISSNDNFNCW